MQPSAAAAVDAGHVGVDVRHEVLIGTQRHRQTDVDARQDERRAGHSRPARGVRLQATVGVSDGDERRVAVGDSADRDSQVGERAAFGRHRAPAARLPPVPGPGSREEADADEIEAGHVVSDELQADRAAVEVKPDPGLEVIGQQR